mgnify:CR=1 FL=1
MSGLFIMTKGSLMPRMCMVRNTASLMRVNVAICSWMVPACSPVMLPYS